MSEGRLLTRDASALERMLLESAAEERPSEALEAKMLAAVSVAAAGTAAASGTAASGTAASGTAASGTAVSDGASPAAGAAPGGSLAPAAGWVASSKWPWIGLALLGVAGVAWWSAQGPRAAMQPHESGTRGDAGAEASSSTFSDPLGRDRSDGDHAAKAADAGAEEPPPRKGQGPDGSVLHGTAAPQSAASAESAASPTASGSSRLREEMRLIDQARATLAAGDAPASLQILQRYRARFPDGALEQEATVLRVKALEVIGEAETAERLSEEFLQTHPDTAHRRRLQEPGDSDAP